MTASAVITVRMMDVMCVLMLIVVDVAVLVRAGMMVHARMMVIVSATAGVMVMMVVMLSVCTSRRMRVPMIQAMRMSGSHAGLVTPALGKHSQLRVEQPNSDQGDEGPARRFDPALGRLDLHARRSHHEHQDADDN